MDPDNENKDTVIFSQENKHLEGETFLKKRKKKFIWKSQPLTQKVLYLYFHCVNYNDILKFTEYNLLSVYHYLLVYFRRY